MKTAMYDARDAMTSMSSTSSAQRAPDSRSTPGEFDRRLAGPAARLREPLPEVPRQQDRQMRHDPLTYIGPDRQNQAPANLPIPVGIFMNMAHVPPRFYNQHQQLMAEAANKTSAPPPAASAAKRVGGKRRGESQLSQGNSLRIWQNTVLRCHAGRSPECEGTTTCCMLRTPIA